MSREATLEPTEDIFAIYNPNSADRATVEGHRDALVEYGTSVGFQVNTAESVPSFLGTISLLKTNVGPNTRIVVISGDGGVHNATNAHDALGLTNGISTLGTGGANDIHTSLHPTEWHSRNPHSVLTSPLVEHRPLRITAEHADIPEDDRRRKLQAVAYFSIGFTAAMASRFNDEDFREKLEGKAPQIRLIQQGAEVLRSVRKFDRPFLVYNERGVRELNEVVYPNGARMAKVNHFRGLELLEPGFGRLRTGKVNYHNVLLSYGRALTGLYTKFDPEHVERFAIETRDEDDILVQADGEAYSYPSGTRFSVSLSEHSLPLATSRTIYHRKQDII